jgi:hypothetical protein
MKVSSLRPAERAAIVALGAVAVAIAVGLGYGIALSVLLLASLALALVIALLWSSVRNLTGDTPLSLDEALGLGAPSPEEEQKRAVLRALKDLEYERSVGKISEADYRDYSARYREEARRLMQRVDASLAEARELAQKMLEERVAQAGIDAAVDPVGGKAVPATEPATTQSKSNEEDEDEDDAPNSKDTDEDEDEDEDEDDAPDSEDTDDEDDEDDAPDSESDEPVIETTHGKANKSACAACSGSNDADAKFCKHCGAALEGDPRAAQKKTPREEKTS